jgi:3-dehydroquinate dehydratase-2
MSPRRLRVLVINGPNLNLLGSREPTIYGRQTLAELQAGIAARAAELGVAVDFFQSNHEGAIIDRIQQRDFDASIVNAGGLTHTSVSLRDALLAIDRPFVEVHLSDPAEREPFRRVNFLEDVAAARFAGMGAAGYHRALEELARRWKAGAIRPGAGTTEAEGRPVAEEPGSAGEQSDARA